MYLKKQLNACKSFHVCAPVVDVDSPFSKNNFMEKISFKILGTFHISWDILLKVLIKPKNVKGFPHVFFFKTNLNAWWTPYLT